MGLQVPTMATRVMPMVFADLDDNYDFQGETRCISLEVRESPSPISPSQYSHTLHTPQQLGHHVDSLCHYTPARSDQVMEATPMAEQTPFSVAKSESECRKEEQLLPIVLVLPSDGGAPCVATPLQPDKKQMPKRSLGNTISDMDLKEVMTQPAPDAQKSRRRRLR